MTARKAPQSPRQRVRRPDRAGDASQGTDALKGPEVRARALALLVEGRTVASVAQTFGVLRKTVRHWRDCPEGQLLSIKLRAERAKHFADVVEPGRARLKELVLPSIEVLAERVLTHRDPMAACQVLDRVGLLRGEMIKVDDGTGQIDPASLSEATLLELREKLEKAKP